MLRAELLLTGMAFAAVVPQAAAQSSAAEDLYYRAYYLEHEEGDVRAAAELYERVVRDRRADADLRRAAEKALAGCREDLSTADFASLVPAETIAYVELSRPGEQLQSLLDQLGVLGRAGEAMREGGRRLAISPELIDQALGIRGAAVAITGFDPQKGEPIGVALLHPGKVDVIRGLIDTALPAGAEQVTPIEGYTTYSVEGAVYVTLTNKLVVASPYKSQIKKVLRNLRGEGEGTLADNPHMQEALAGRGDELLFFCVNAEPVKPMIRLALASESRHNPEAAMAQALLDVESLRSLSGSVGVNGEGLSVDMELALEDGHRNLVFNFLRMPALDESTLRRVPAGSAAFAAFALNERRPAVPSEGEAIVTGMDLGREIFGNIVSCAVFAMPGAEVGGPWPMPNVAAVFTVNDPSKSEALWNMMLGLGSMASGRGAMEGERVSLGRVEARSFEIQDGPTIYTAVAGDELVVATTRAALEASLGASRDRSVLEDKAFKHHIAALSDDCVKALFVHPGRCAEIAKAFVPSHEMAEAEPYLGLLDDTVFSTALQHSDNRLRMSVQLTGIPDVGELVGQLIDHEVNGGGRFVYDDGGGTHTVAAATRGGHEAPAPKPVTTAVVSDGWSEKPQVKHAATHDLQALQAKLRTLASSPDTRGAARDVARKIGELIHGDAGALNSLAWKLLTEAPYEGHFAEIASSLSHRSNELTQFKEWMYVDTLALAEFQLGHIDEAVSIEERALELVGDGPRRGEVEEALERFRKAARKERTASPSSR